MQSSKPHFEQIPVEVVKKITEEFHDDVAGSHSATHRNFAEQVEATALGFAGQATESASNRGTPGAGNKLLDLRQASRG